MYEDSKSTCLQGAPLSEVELSSFVLRHHKLVPRQIQWHSLHLLVFSRFIYPKIPKLDTSPTHKVVQIKTQNFEGMSHGVH